MPTMHTYMAPAGITHAVTRLVHAASPAIDDAARIVEDVTRSARPMSGPAGDAHEGALRVTILSDATDSDGLAMVDRFRERGVEAVLHGVRELGVDPVSGRYAVGGVDAPRPDLVIPYHPNFESAELDTLVQLERMGIPLMNPSGGVVASRDKALTAQLLVDAGVRHPQTVVVDHHSQVRSAVEAVARPGSPIFLKNPVGTQGIGVAGISDAEEAISAGELITAYGGRRLLVQGGVDLAPGTPLHDTRHFIVDGRVIASMDRFNADGQLRGGLHSGGRGAAAQHASPEEIEMAERAAQALGLRGVAGVDVFGGHVLEVNYGPGHRIGTITGTDVTRAVVDHATELARAARTAQA